MIFRRFYRSILKSVHPRKLFIHPSAPGAASMLSDAVWLPSPSCRWWSCCLHHHRIDSDQAVRLGRKDTDQRHESQSGATPGAICDCAETFACSSGEVWSHWEGKLMSSHSQWWIAAAFFFRLHSGRWIAFVFYTGWFDPIPWLLLFTSVDWGSDLSYFFTMVRFRV